MGGLFLVFPYCSPPPKAWVLEKKSLFQRRVFFAPLLGAQPPVKKIFGAAKAPLGFTWRHHKGDSTVSEKKPSWTP